MIKINERTFVAARAVDVVRVARAYTGNPHDREQLEVQVWCGTNCIVAQGGYHMFDGAHRQRAEALCEDLVAKIDAALTDAPA